MKQKYEVKFNNKRIIIRNHIKDFGFSFPIMLSYITYDYSLIIPNSVKSIDLYRYTKICEIPNTIKSFRHQNNKKNNKKIIEYMGYY